MSKRNIWKPGKEPKNAPMVAQDAETVSSGASTSTSRPATPTTLDRLTRRMKHPFRSSTPKSTTEPVSAAPIDSTQQVQPVEDVAGPTSLIVPGMDIPFKGAPDDRTGEIAIYDMGIRVVAFLRELAEFTGPGVPNPVPSILKALTGVLTQLQQMVKNEGEWKELFLLISKHLETFNRQLHLLDLGAVSPDSTSALHGPIVQYSATLREMTAKILDDAGFDPTGGKEKSDWIRLVDFFGQYWSAGEVPGKIEDYRKQLSEAMDLLLRDQLLFTAVKMEETNTVVKDTNNVAKETNTGVKEILQKMNDKSTSITATGSRVITKSLPAISPYFVVRQPEMNYMKNQVFESEYVGQKVFAVIGMGGSGKTQLVSYFIQEANKNKKLFTHVIFVDASSEVTLKADLQSWARSLGVGHEQDDWNHCMEFLAEGPHEGRWAMVLDNADDQSLELNQFFPRCPNGTIFLTSRDPSTEHLATIGHLELERMTTDQALATLESAAGREIPKNSTEFESAQTLMQELGCLPLALVHAGTYCRSQSSSSNGKNQTFTFGQYYSLFQKKRAALMEETRSFTRDGYKRGVYTALYISYQAVKLPSRHFLHLIANYHYSEIPFAMFLAAARECFKDPKTVLPRPNGHLNVVAQLNALLCSDGEPDEFQLRELTGDLRSFSLVSPGEDSLFLRMHPLVQSWVRDMALKNEHDYRTMAVQVVTSCCLDRNTAIYRYLLPHIGEILEAKKDMNVHVNDKMAFAWVLDKSGRYKTAEMLLAETLKSLREESEGETADMLYVNSQLATSYWNQGRWDEAEKLDVDVLEKRQRTLGADHPDSLDSAAHLASTYRNQGRWDEAEMLGVDVLEKRQRTLGADHPDSLDSAANLASTYWNQGRWDEAEKLEVDVLEKRQRTLGADHPDSLSTAANLASTYWNQGRWDEAERMELDVLEKCKRNLGMEHPDTIHAAHSLAATFCSQGKWQDAEPMLALAVEQSVRVIGRQHPDAQLYIRGLLIVYEMLEKWDKVMETRGLLIST